MSNRHKKISNIVWEDLLDDYDIENIQQILAVIRHIGRNDPCWCASGKKYKHCHMNRSRENPLRIHEYTKIVQKFCDKGYCLQLAWKK